MLNSIYQHFFTGREYDAESGLYYYRARHYSATLGRFLQRDPIGIWEDETNLGNGYTYVGNNGVNGTDAMGLVQGEKNEDTGPSCGMSFWLCEMRCYMAALEAGVIFSTVTTPIGGAVAQIAVFTGCSYVCMCMFCHGDWIDIICFKGTINNKCKSSSHYDSSQILLILSLIKQ